MKKIFCVLLSLLLIVAMAIPARAVTPALPVPDMPEIPDIGGNISIELPDDFWDKWFEEHPVPPLAPTEPQDPGAGENVSAVPVWSGWARWFHERFPEWPRWRYVGPG